MIAASEIASPPTRAVENAAGACGVVAAISMPRSSAAVLTPISTPPESESCADSLPGEVVEVPADEGDSRPRAGLGSSAMPGEKTGKWLGDKSPSHAPAADRLTRPAKRRKLRPRPLKDQRKNGIPRRRIAPLDSCGRRLHNPQVNV